MPPPRPSNRAGRGVRGVLFVAVLVVLATALAWVAWAGAFGDRTTAMVVALSATCAVAAAFMTRVDRGGMSAVVATLAMGGTPVIAWATLRVLSEPLMGEAFVDGAARQREAMVSIAVAVGLAAVCALVAGFLVRRPSGAGRGQRWGRAVMIWSPVAVVPAVLSFTLADGYRSPEPAGYSLAQPVLGHMDPPRDGELVVDELEREEGVALVRVCEGKPWCYTVLRRGDLVSTRPGFVSRSAPVHLRFDAKHDLYLVESNGTLVATIQAATLASYTQLLPHHVKRSLAPPRAFQLLAAASLLVVLVLLGLRHRLGIRKAASQLGDAGVCFGDGWGLLSDGTTMRMPPDMKRGSFLLLWGKTSERTLSLLEGTRAEIAKRFDDRGRALDAMQLAAMWTLCTPLLISAAVV